MARNLQTQWNTFTPEEKKNIIETITKSIIVGKEDIEINLSYIPTLSQEGKKAINTGVDHHNQIIVTMQQTLNGSFVVASGYVAG